MAAEAVTKTVIETTPGIELVRFVCFDQNTEELLRSALVVSAVEVLFPSDNTDEQLTLPFPHLIGEYHHHDPTIDAIDQIVNLEYLKAARDNDEGRDRGPVQRLRSRQCRGAGRALHRARRQLPGARSSPAGRPG